MTILLLVLPSPALPGQSLARYGHWSYPVDLLAPPMLTTMFKGVLKPTHTHTHTLRNWFCEGLQRLVTHLRRRKSVAGRRSLAHRDVASQKNEV